MDEILHKVMPHSLEAEQAVLGAMLIDSRSVAEVIHRLKPSDFYLQSNLEIFETILMMFNYSKVIDPVTLLDQMRQQEKASDATARYIVELMNITPTAGNVMEYVAIVEERALMRAVAETAGEITDLVRTGGGTADEVLEIAELSNSILDDPPSALGFDIDKDFVLKVARYTYGLIMLIDIDKLLV